LATRHKSAIKRHRQNLKRQERNTAIRTRVRHIIRETRAAIGGTDVEAAEQQLRTAIKALTKAASKGVLHRNSASRRISRLSKQVASRKAS
jgi:small subunit ribosomal protein S20